MNFSNDFKESLDKLILELNEIKDIEGIYSFEKKYLDGKESLFSSFLFELKSLKTTQEKRKIGIEINLWKDRLLKEKNIIKKKIFETSKINKNNNYFFQDREIKIGKFHLIKKEMDEIYNFFTFLGYDIFESEEVDNSWYNFDSLNMKKDHPARSLTDTFYFSDDLNVLLRTHTSNCQVRAIENNKKKNIMFVSGGKVYRNDDDDPTHSHQYTNFEIVNIGKNINFANLKWTLEKFFKWFFNEDLKIRVRPSYFPFTEPSFEVDISCINCSKNGKKCSICKGTRWIEVLGAGLIHPKVLENGGCEKRKSGFAIGMGIERIIMIKYRINDIRDFYSNDLRFLKITG